MNKGKQNMTDTTVNSSIRFDRQSGKYVAMADGKIVTQSKNLNRAKRLLKAHLAGLVQIEREEKASGVSFSVADRFEFVEALASMVATGKSPSAIITGEGGIGKTFTVMKTLRSLGLVASTDDEAEDTAPSKVFTVVKGFSTPMALYRTLYENSDKVVVFDDCDSILKDPTAINLLKAALDSYGKRIVSWQSEQRGNDLPSSFQFHGGVIFISNHTLGTLDHAVRTRALCVDLSMTADQKLERMAQIVESGDFLEDMPEDYKRDALACIKTNLSKVRNLSLRTLLQVAKVRSTDRRDWQRLALYVMAQ
jgi:hypothetical protein